DRFAHSKQQPQAEERRKAGAEAGGESGGGPQEKTGTEYPSHIVAVDEPAREDLAKRVGPEERREKQTQLRRGELGVAGELRRGNRKRAPVDVVDADRER